MVILKCQHMLNQWNNQLLQKMETSELKKSMRPHYF